MVISYGSTYKYSCELLAIQKTLLVSTLVGIFSRIFSFIPYLTTYDMISVFDLYFLTEDSLMLQGHYSKHG